MCAYIHIYTNIYTHVYNNTKIVIKEGILFHQVELCHQNPDLPLKDIPDVTQRWWRICDQIIICWGKNVLKRNGNQFTFLFSLKQIVKVCKITFLGNQPHYIRVGLFVESVVIPKTLELKENKHSGLDQWNPCFKKAHKIL